MLDWLLVPGANLIDVLADLFEPLCVLIFPGTFLNLKNIKMPRLFAQGSKKLPALGHYIILWFNLSLKPQERVTNNRLDLGQASVAA